MAKEIKHFGFECSNCSCRVSVVKNSRPHRLGIRRRRKCRDCSASYSTIEIKRDDYDELISRLADETKKTEAIKSLIELFK